jgi:hypothetical protein
MYDSKDWDYVGGHPAKVAQQIIPVKPLQQGQTLPLVACARQAFFINSCEKSLTTLELHTVSTENQFKAPHFTHKHWIYCSKGGHSLFAIRGSRIVNLSPFYLPANIA